MEFQKYNVKEKMKRKREKTNKNKQSHKNYKENIGTKLITNTKKLKLKSRVWNFKNTMLKKKGNLGVVLERRPQCAVSHEVRRRGQ